MPGLPYYNGQVLTPPDYLSAHPAYGRYPQPSYPYGVTSQMIPPVPVQYDYPYKQSLRYQEVQQVQQQQVQQAQQQQQQQQQVQKSQLQQLPPIQLQPSQPSQPPQYQSLQPPHQPPQSQHLSQQLQPLPHSQPLYNMNVPSNHHHHTTSFSSNGTTFFVPTVPLDQMSMVNHGQPIYGHNHTNSNNHNRSNSHNNNHSHGHHSHSIPHSHSQSDPNSNPPTGGVTATLDYEIDHMADFLSTMAFGIMIPNTQTWDNSSFTSYKKFVIQVLTATRLPKSTIILALVYLSKKWAISKVKVDSRTPYTMLVVALLLSNKFHDDNTFTNKSWNEATGIAVQDLTRIEAQWLCEIQWSLFLNENDLKGWHKWNHCWKVYMSSKTEGEYIDGLPSPSSPYYSRETSPIRNTSPRRATYTIPKWYETANQRRPITQQQHTSLALANVTNSNEPFVSYFQQSFTMAGNYDEEKSLESYNRRQYYNYQYPQSYYMAAYNHLSTCNCSLCVFEPMKQPINSGWFGSSVVAC